MYNDKLIVTVALKIQYHTALAMTLEKIYICREVQHILM